jgi:hypothetical protein
MSVLLSLKLPGFHCNPFDAIFLKFGTFDQYDMRFSTGSRGNQCTCNCLVYLVLSFVKHDQNRSEDDCLKLSARASCNVKNPADEKLFVWQHQTGCSFFQS